MRLGYLISRFPVATETFILRELNALQREVDQPIELFSLFPPQSAFAHPAAAAWVPRLRQASPRSTLGGVLWALATRPGKLLGVLATTARAYAGSPHHLPRALLTVLAATGHARTAQALRLDHLHAHWANYPALAALAMRRLVGVTYSFTPHAHDIFTDQSNLGRLIDDAAFVVAISDYNRFFLGRYRRTDTPLPVVRYGIDTEHFAHDPRPLPAEGPVHALCVASLMEQKGHDVLLDALRLGGAALERIHVDLVGAGPLREHLEARVAAEGLGDRVRFLGVLSEDEVAERLRAADLAVLPSIVGSNGRQEGLPNVLLEALAVGRPAVGTAVSGIPELLREEATCLLAMPGDAPSLAAALDHVLRHPEAAARRAQAGRRLVERDYTIERAGRVMAELLREATS
jgi:glycosyltransferase involved in cell wall biosynthesis